jgi:hypothetical protein
MNKFIILFGLLASSFAQAQSYKFMKSFDGKAVYCEKDTSVGKEGYQVENPSLQIDPNGTIDFQFDNKYVACSTSSTSPTGFEWTATTLKSSYTYTAIPNNEKVLMEFEDLTMMVLNDQYHVVAQSAIVANAKATSFSYQFDVNDALKDPSKSKELAGGQTVKARIEVFILAQRTYMTVNNGPRTQLGMRAWGSFYLNFEVQKTKTGYKATNLKLK